MTEAAAVAPLPRVEQPSAPSANRPGLQACTHRRLELVLAAALYLSFACYLTWPLVSDLSHNLYGTEGDPYGTIAFFRIVVDHHYDPFLPGVIRQWGAPSGIPIPWPRDLASAPWVLTLYLLTAFFGGLAAFGLYALAGYVLTGVATFLFVRRLTGNAWAAWIVGWAYAFYPFAAINGQVHPEYTQGWLFVLVAWRLVELMCHPTRRNGLLAGMAVTLCMWSCPYFILFGGLEYGVITVVVLLAEARRRRLRSVLVPQLLTGVVVAAFAVGLGALAFVGESSNIGVRTHELSEFSYYAARPAEYLLPDVQSPLFGSLTQGVLARYPHAGTGFETTLYVGATLLLLALVALVALARRRLVPRVGRVVLALSLLVLVVAITSMPPKAQVLGVDVPLPAYFITQVTTTWRVYSRMVIVVMLGVTVLAGVGLDVITRGLTARKRAIAMCIATVAIAVDLWAPQHGQVEKVSVPGIYKTLSRQPPGLVAEYPLAPTGRNHYRDIFFQSAYDMPLMNSFPSDSLLERLAYSVSVLDAPDTASRLATLGVRYVIVTSTLSTLGWPIDGRPGKGFHRIAREAYRELYAVTAAPQAPALVAGGEGIGEQKVDGSTVYVAEQPRGTIELLGHCSACSGTLSMTLRSYGVPHHVTLIGAAGEMLAHGEVGPGSRVSLPLRFSDHTKITVLVTPAPQAESTIPPSRGSSVLIEELGFLGTRRR
jgi:hypothetical protein